MKVLNIHKDYCILLLLCLFLHVFVEKNKIKSQTVATDWVYTCIDLFLSLYISLLPFLKSVKGSGVTARFELPAVGIGLLSKYVPGGLLQMCDSTSWGK